MHFKNTNWSSRSLANLFIAGRIVRSIIFFLIYPKAWCVAPMFTRPKVTKPRDRDVISSRPRRDRDVQPSRPRRDRDVEPSRPRRDRDVRFCQTLKTETRPRRSTFKTKTFQKTSRDRLETETFKTETTSLVCHTHQPLLHGSRY